MEAKDLRIGNLTNFGKVTDIHADHFYTLDEDHISYKSAWAEIKGIPLSEEWLVRMGLIKDEWSYKFPIDGGNTAYSIELYGNQFGFGYGGEVTKETWFKYVHQVQNAFFALTGTELEIKEER